MTLLVFRKCHLREVLKFSLHWRILLNTEGSESDFAACLLNGLNDFFPAACSRLALKRESSTALLTFSAIVYYPFALIHQTP